MSPKDTAINFSGKDGCLKRSYAGGGGTAVLMYTDARHFAEGCKSQILVSLRVFGTERHHICPCRCRLGL